MNYLTETSIVPLLHRLPQQYPVTNPTTKAATAPAETVMISVSSENTIDDETGSKEFPSKFLFF